MQIRIFLIFIALFSFWLSATLAHGDAKKPTKVIVYHTVENYPFCQTKSDLLFMAQLQEQNDLEAIARLVAARSCDFLKADKEVYLMDVDKRLALVKVRPKGYTVAFWTSALALKEGPAPKKRGSLSPDQERAIMEIESLINNLLDDYTTCVPAMNSDTAASPSILIVSDKEIFTISARKKAWIVMCIGVVGSILNDNPKLKFDVVAMSDPKSIEQGNALVVPVEKAMQLQQDVKNGKMTLDQLYSDITANYTFQHYEIPKDQ